MDLQTFLDDFMNKDDLELLVRDASALFDCPAMVVDMAFRVVAWHCAADFEEAARRCFQCAAGKPMERRVVFLNSWNEWGEGAYVEPDAEFGDQFLKALARQLRR